MNIVIPMPDMDAVVIDLPDRVTRSQWDYFMNVLKVMEPGLVRLPSVGQIGPTQPEDPQALSHGTMEYLRVQCPNCHAKPNEWCNLIDKYGIIARPTFQICAERIDLSKEPM